MYATLPYLTFTALLKGLGRHSGLDIKITAQRNLRGRDFRSKGDSFLCFLTKGKDFFGSNCQVEKLLVVFVSVQ